MRERTTIIKINGEEATARDVECFLEDFFTDAKPYLTQLIKQSSISFMGQKIEYTGPYPLLWSIYK